MSETHDSLKIRALEIAATVGGEAAADVVKRASAYHSFLSGVATATAPQSGTSAKGESTGTGTSGKGSTTTGATAPKNTAAPKGTTAPKNTAAPKGAAATNKPATTKQNVGTNGFPADDTKAPGAKNDFAAMCKKLRAVMQDSTNGGKAEATRILAEDGNGATSVRDLDPKFYDSVVEACDNVLNPGDAGEETGGEGADDDIGL